MPKKPFAEEFIPLATLPKYDYQIVVMGAIVLGCLANSYVTCTSYLSIPVGTGAIDLQSTLDSILVGGVPLAITLLTWYLLKKKNMSEAPFR